jgi:predicted DNA-binding transcriptional regulator AlpA
MFRVITVVLIISTVVAVASAIMPSADHINAVIAAVAVAALGVRAERTIRLHELPTFLGVQRSQVNELIKKKLLHPRPAYPGARAMVVTESEVITLQQAAAAEAEAKTDAGEKPIEIAPNRNRKRRLASKVADEETHAI